MARGITSERMWKVVVQDTKEVLMEGLLSQEQAEIFCQRWVETFWPYSPRLAPTLRCEEQR